MRVGSGGSQLTSSRRGLGDLADEDGGDGDDDGDDGGGFHCDEAEMLESDTFKSFPSFWFVVKELKLFRRNVYT